MWMNGSSSARLTPANARRTGKPSPSVPRGAVVTDRTGRAIEATSGVAMLGTVSGSAVTAGMTTPYES